MKNTTSKKRQKKISWLSDDDEPQDMESWNAETPKPFMADQKKLNINNSEEIIIDIDPFDYVRNRNIETKCKHGLIVDKKNIIRFMPNGLESETRSDINRIITFAKSGTKHPNSLLKKTFLTYKSSGVLIECDAPNAGSLSYYIDLLREKFSINNREYEEATKTQNINEQKRLFAEKLELKKHQIQMAKSVSRQLIDYSFYLDSVLGCAHKNLNPDTIFLNHDGCIKVGFFNYLSEEHIKKNPYHYMIYNAYTAPELISELFFEKGKILDISEYKKKCLENLRTIGDIKNLADIRYNFSKTKTDIWSIGAIIFSIMMCSNYMPSWGTNSDISDLEILNTIKNPDENHAMNFDDFLEFLIDKNERKWIKLFGNDPYLAELAKMCLQTDENERENISNLNAFIYLHGGYNFEKETENFSETYIKNVTEKIGEYLYTFSLLHDWSGVRDAFMTNYDVLKKTKILENMKFSHSMESGLIYEKYSHKNTEKKLLNDFYDYPTTDKSKLMLISEVLHLEKLKFKIKRENCKSDYELEKLEETESIITSQRQEYARVALSRSIAFLSSEFIIYY